MPLIWTVLLLLVGALVLRGDRSIMELPPKQWEARCSARLEKAKRRLDALPSDDELAQLHVNSSELAWVSECGYRPRAESKLRWGARGREIGVSVSEWGYDERFDKDWQQAGYAFTRVFNGRIATIWTRGLPRAQMDRFVELFKPAVDDCLNTNRWTVLDPSDL